MKVLITDKVADKCLEQLNQFNGVQVDLKIGLDESEIISIIDGYQALIVRSATKVTKAIIDASNSLKVIGRAGAGVDNIDVKSATDKGILVMNTPGANASAVAELSIGLMFSLARNISQADASMKAGKWEKKLFTGIELSEKVLGLIGIGNIGGLVGQKALALGMKVLANDPYITEDKIKSMGFLNMSLDQLLNKADFISVHIPKTAETKGFINKDTFNKMKHGVYFINCSRGGIVVEQDLLDALASDKIAGAGIDVYENEPPEDLSLIKHQKVIATPHIGASSKEAQINVAVMIAKQVGNYLTKDEIVNAVNKT